MRIDLQDQFNHNGPAISADHSHQEPAPQAGVAVRLYANQKMGTTFGPGKYRTAIYNATADVDLSRISAAPSARLSHFSFKSDRAFPPQG